MILDEIEPERIPLLSADDLASSELRKWREERERKHIAENVMLTSETDRSFLPISAQTITPSKPVEEKPVEEKPVEEKPKEPEPQVTIIQNDLLAEREKQMAALLQSIPAVLEKKEEEKKEEKKKEEEEKKKEEEEKKKEEEEKPPVKMIDLSLVKGSMTELSIAMPEGKPVYFTATVIDSPSDIEVSSVSLEECLSVIGRMNILTCETYLNHRKESSNFDVIWWILELDKKSDE